MRSNVGAEFLTLLTLAAVAGPAGANIGVMRSHGGSLGLLTSEHPAVAMASEQVVADLYPEYVEVACRFHLRNTGQAQSLLMGFPDLYGYKTQPLYALRLFVDGRRVPTQRLEDRPLSGRPRWYTARVRFAARQERVVDVAYWHRYDEPPYAASGLRTFIYVLWTGRTWKGSIGKADIVVRLHLERGQRVTGAALAWSGDCLTPPRRSGAQLAWHLTDFEPGKEAQLTVDWRAWLVVQYAGNVYAPTGEEFVPRVREEHGMAWVYAADIGYYLGYAPRWDEGAGTLTLRGKRGRMTLRVGSPSANVNGGQYRLPAAPRWRGGRVQVPCRAVCEALGYQLRYDAGEATLWLSRSPSS
jgi:Copper amine oxidase N-terminal domain